MNNDNTNTVVFEKRLLIEKAKNYAAFETGGVTFNNHEKYKAFRDGQDNIIEQLQPLIDSHRELLEWVIELRKIASNEISEFNIPKLNEAIQKANNIKP